MYKLSIGLGYSVFKHCVELSIIQSPDVRMIVQKILNQRIVLNDRIIAYYKECDEENSDLIDMFITANAGYDCVDYCEALNSESITEELVNALSINPMKILVAEKAEFDKKSIKKLRLITPEDIVADPYNPINMYSLPITNLKVSEGENKEKYLKWIGNLIQGETVIRIIDPYILTERGINVLNYCYLPYIDATSNIEIYGTDANIGSWTLEKLIERIDRSGHNIKVFLYSSGTEHDRFIWAGNVQIGIGKGLDFVDYRSDIIRKKTYISVTEANFDSPDVIKEIIY